MNFKIVIIRNSNLLFSPKGFQYPEVHVRRSMNQKESSNQRRIGVIEEKSLPKMF